MAMMGGEPVRHRLFKDHEAIGASQSDDGGEELAGKAVNESLNPFDLRAIRMQLAEADQDARNVNIKPTPVRKEGSCW